MAFNCCLLSSSHYAAIVLIHYRVFLLQTRWSSLGLPFKPSMAANGCHASAGPLEGLKERLVWCAQDTAYSDASLASDSFGQALLERGVAPATLRQWLQENPVVSAPGGIGPDKVFDLTEGMDSANVLGLAPKFSTAE